MSKRNLRRPAGWSPGWTKWVALAALGLVADGAAAQTSPPVMERGEKIGMLITGAAPLGTPVPTGQVARLEELLAMVARKDALAIATTYARTTSSHLRGVQELGRQLMDELGKRGPNLDFKGVVSHNPAFWQAERELAPTDVSLPYLTALLAILDRDYVTAARTIALAQAALPLTTTVRRGYSRPEAMMLYLDSLFLTGIPSIDQVQNVEQCDRCIAMLRERVARWSNRPSLLRSLIEMEVRRVELLTRDGENLGMLEQPISQRLQLTPADLAYARQNDPILAGGFDATVRQWLSQSTLAQQWSRWIEFGYPAGQEEIEASVTAYANNGRPDLAWLTWRARLAMNVVTTAAAEQQWRAWCDTLLDPKSAAFVKETAAANRFAGLATMPVDYEGFSEAWSGDLRIHPLLVVKIERQIAMIDTMLAVIPPASSLEGEYRLKRAHELAEIDAVEPARAELRRVREMIHNSDRMMERPGVKVMEVIKTIEARLLDTEGHFAEAEDLYRELLRNPRFAILRVNYLAHLFIAGDLREARDQYRAYARAHPDDPYRSIMADLVARRFGLRETKILEEARQHILAETWPADGVRYLLGQLTEEELLASARKGTGFQIIDHECEAYFWLGEVALAEGRKDDAIKWLNHCLATGYLTDVEFKIAKAELKRLVPESEEKKEKSPPENSSGTVTT